MATQTMFGSQWIAWWAVTQGQAHAGVVFHGAEGSSGGGQGHRQGHTSWCQHPVSFNPFYFAIQRWLLREAGAGREEELTGSVSGHP